MLPGSTPKKPATCVMRSWSIPPVWLNASPKVSTLSKACSTRRRLVDPARALETTMINSAMPRSSRHTGTAARRATAPSLRTDADPSRRAARRKARAGRGAAAHPRRDFRIGSAGPAGRSPRPIWRVTNRAASARATARRSRALGITAPPRPSPSAEADGTGRRSAPPVGPGDICGRTLWRARSGPNRRDRTEGANAGSMRRKPLRNDPELGDARSMAEMPGPSSS